MIWTPDRLASILDQARTTIDGVLAIDHVRHLANVARWSVLYEYGGMWADTDVTPLGDFADYLYRDYPWSAAIGPIPTPFVCGGPAHHDLWQRTLIAAITDPQGRSPDASGGRLLGRVMDLDELHLEPAGLFAGHDARGQLLLTPGPRQSTHEWATSSQRYLDPDPVT